MDSEEIADDGRPPFDFSRASELLGKYVLVGIAYRDAADNITEQRQYHGDVVVANSREGFCLKLRGLREGEFEWLPPDTRAFSEARPGHYRLRSTGETVVDPDFTTTWTYQAPDAANE